MSKRILIGRWVRVGLSVVLLVAFAPANGQVVLTLPDVERMSVSNDPAVHNLVHLAAGLRERAVAVAQLPDPKLKLGLAALPVDTLDLAQEPMTQLQLGVQQRFFPGDTLELRGRQLVIRADALDLRSVDQELITLRSVREDYLEVHYQRRASRIINEARSVFEELLAVTKDHYATGRTQQQDVFRAELELSRLDDRATRIAQAEEMARARLALWIGDAAYGHLSGDWPSLAAPSPLGAMVDALDHHPRILWFSGQIQAAEIGIDVAREQYKPGWMIDLTYSDRTGQNVDGSARSDFLSAMVTIDLPIFRGKRQDRDLAASVKDFDAATAARQDIYRRLRRSAEHEWAAFDRLNERLVLFRENLLPEAAANSEASMAAYQSGVSDFTTLMRARITEYELRLDETRARTDRLIAQARLLYLNGEQR